ncbi:adenylate/guanylate cyclase domain-containing protein [Aggregicoccus sp. 17bor-14]|uniref:adenylate/guanylate cyclase domain-containing protein n=1 Tax=Myxococcaceae TaxID=31 RepID=UPI00129CE63E|nr:MULTISPECIES: adenylate/guanylate cyclase domain-containing protein [Myxococcaceae]MBF5044134.1 adenylate/guanylate cyclase domain-containing protein [Simulacricoccus sp. 17bor-14]MRI89884.1 adenylate/guanylate cyclase domain-containing protein [Aggregicoccus sp. 17bor-14]
MRTANLAIVFTDIQGFTERTSRQTLEENQRLLQVHAALLTPLFKAFGGRVVKSIGDAFLVTFESPTQAVLSGIAIQDRLWQHNRSAPEAERMSVRVAINVGEVRLESNDVFGEPVNIAARVEALTEAGEVYFTEAVYLAMNKAEVPSQEVGAFELKGIPGRIRVFRVPHAPYRVEAPTAQPQPAADALPPFGNLGLSRLPEGRSVAAAELASSVGQHAARLGTRAASVGGQLVASAGQALAAARNGEGARRLNRRHVALAVGGAVALGLLLFFLLGSPAERAIGRVADASGAERDARRDEAERLIAEEPDAAERAYLNGQLEEALGSAGRAVGAYRNAARAGHGKAERRLVQLLEHRECRVRASAAGALGDLHAKGARGALEDLAEDGGPDEGADIPLFGCNSRRAAQDALRRLGP